jgi:hypothetical protein
MPRKLSEILTRQMAFLGSFFILAALVSGEFSSMLVPESSEPPPLGQATLAQRRIVDPRTPKRFEVTDKLRLLIEYPLELRMNQTGTVKVRLSRDQEIWDYTSSPKRIVHRERNEVPTSFTLGSLAIEVLAPPAKTIPAGAKLPAERLWSIKPKNEGDHNLILNVSSALMTASSADLVEANLLVNGDTLQLPPTGDIPLPLEVTTVWGVSEVTVNIVRAGIGLVGFILMYPLLVEFLRGRHRVSCHRVMQQQPLDYRGPTTGLAVHWTRKPLYWLLFVVPSLPLLIFLIPRGMTFLSEPTDPWYTPYTTPVWLLVAFYVYPATALGMLVGVPPRSPGWIVIVLLYTGLIGWGICSWKARRRAAA